MLNYQPYPYPCDRCGVVIRCLSEEGLAFNIGAGPEHYCKACAPPSDNPKDAIRLIDEFINFKRDTKP